MSDAVVRLALSLLAALGLLATIWGLVSAYVKTRRDLDMRRRRFQRHDELLRQNVAELKNRPAGLSAKDWRVAQESIGARYEALRAAESLPSLQMIDLDPTGQLAAIDVLSESLKAVRANLLWAGLGAVVATLAGVAALWIG